MKLFKNKKTLKIAAFSSFFIASTVAAAGATLASCSTKKNVTVPATTASSFSSLTSSILPTVASVLSSTSGRTTLTKSYVNKLLLNWFKVVSDSSIEVTYKQWVKDAEKAYKTEYDNYKKKRGANWQQLFQQNVLDPVGGTKQDYINNNIANNIKTTFIDYLFGTSSKEYLGYKSSSDSSITPINNINLVSLSDIDNSYVNAANAGEKNGFTFSAEAVASNERKTIDYGYADFMEYLMDSWIENALPLPLSMSLWKNGTSEQKIKALFSSYFTQDSTPEGYTSGSYAFQYFEPITDSNLQTLTTTGKFKILMTNLAGGSYVGSTTGLIKLDSSYTEDSSTTLIVPATNLFDGTYVTPFSAGAWYKFSNAVFGVSDENVPTASSIDASSIMKNFLTYSTTSNAADSTNTGVFSFPYSTTWKNTYTNEEGSVFLGEYENATGVRDVVNLSSATTIASDSTSAAASTNQLGNFILVRNTYGVHLIGIDRLSQMTAAANSVTGTTDADFASKFQKVCNELRNTFIYYYALDTVGGTSTYSVKDKLKTYLTDNFETLLIKYVEKSVDDASGQANNLFGVKATTDLSSDTTVDYTNNFGFPSSGSTDYSGYYNTLNEIKSDTQLRKLIDAAQAYATAESLNSFNSTLKSAIYSNQSTYNSNASSSTWIQNGIAGVLPYKRDSQTGDFTSLMTVFNNIAKAKFTTSSSTSSSSSSSTARNASARATGGQLTAQTTTVSTNTGTSTSLSIAKNNYQTSVVSFLNSIDLVVDPNNRTTGKATYIFTNNYYVNQALLTTGSDGTLNAIVYNTYVQKYLLPNGVDNWHLTKPTSSSSSTATAGSTEWTFDKIYSGIKSTYFVSSFAGISNVYSQGDWKTQSDFETLATNYWYSNWEATQYSYTFTDSTDNASGTSFYSYSTPDNAKSYYNFLSTINYLLSYDSSTQTFSFDKLYEVLNNATTVTSSNSGKAMVAWQNMSSIVANPSYGVTSSTSASAIQSKVQEDSTFKSLPFYLTNSNSYSWYGNTNPYTVMNTADTDTSATFTKKDLSYTTSTSYWYSAPMSSTSGATSNTGFLGFQFENTSDTGVATSLPSDAFTNSTYANPISYKNGTTEEVKYRGMFYSFASRSAMISYVQGLSTANLLSTFYQNNLRDSGLPVTDANKTKIKDIIDNDSITGSERVKQLQDAIVAVLNDTEQVPDSAFQKMDAMPLWNNSNNVQSTLFSSSDSTGALKNEYVITQFNNSDVQKLLTTDSSTGTNTLNTGEGAYLGLNSTTFFNAIIMLCNSSTTLQDQANDAMLRTNGKISVYDIRLLSVLGRSYISNYDVWEKVKNLS